MPQTKRPYETTFIVNASLEDAQIDSLVTHAQELVTRNGGEMVAVNRWGRKRLAYPIQKKNNGFYINMEYTAPGPVIPQLERMFQLDESVLRFLTIQIDERAEKARLEQAARRAAAPESALPPPPLSSPASPPSPVAAAPPEVKEPLFKDEGERPQPSKPAAGS